jgi:hypothetical protein
MSEANAFALSVIHAFFIYKALFVDFIDCLSSAYLLNINNLFNSKVVFSGLFWR